MDKEKSMEMPKVQQCDVNQCAYNEEQQCHALAITIGDNDEPECDTYFKHSERGGDKSSIAGVGACKVTGCSWNKDLECSASKIMVGLKEQDVDCLTYQPK
jgi:hypothetical protein